MSETLSQLKTQRVIPVVRTRSVGETGEMVRILYAAGMRLIELTLTIPDVLAVVAQFRQSYPDLLIGIGTIRTALQAREAVDVGASLLITYKASESVANVGQQCSVPYILGAWTPTEVDRCLELGSAVVKWFPASIHGPAALRELQGPLPDAKFFPTGGIRVETMQEWFAAGAVAVGIGGDLLGPGIGHEDVILARARTAMRIAAEPYRASPETAAVSQTAKKGKGGSYA